MIVSVTGLVRTVLAGGVGAGLVYAAMQAPGAVALGPSSNADTSRDGGTTTVRTSALVCPGPELKGLAGLPDLPVGVTVSAAAAPRARAHRAGPAAQWWRVLDRRPRRRLGPGPVGLPGVVASAPLGRPEAAVVRGSQSLAPGLAATQAWLVGSGDHRSLGVAACGRPSADAWLLAGAAPPAARSGWC